MLLKTNLVALRAFDTLLSHVGRGRIFVSIVVGRDAIAMISCFGHTMAFLSV